MCIITSYDQFVVVGKRNYSESLKILTTDVLLNCRDIFWQGKCDDGCYALADLMGWGVSNFLEFTICQFDD